MADIDLAYSLRCSNMWTKPDWSPAVRLINIHFQQTSWLRKSMLSGS